MKRRLFAYLIGAAITLLASGLIHAADENSLTVMSFNLRFASDKKPNSWPERRSVMAECIKEASPDFIGTQEGVYHQLKDLEADLGNYSWIGLGREGGSKGEFMAIYFKKDRFAPLEYDHYWLSDTPNVIASASWGNQVKRMVTWVRFKDKQSQKEFYLVNSHFDHQVQAAREKSAELVAEKIKTLNTKLPIIFTCDFNATAGNNKTYDILVNEELFRDTWTEAKERKGKVVKTFHNFTGPVEGDNRIDWILVRGEVKTEAIEIQTCSRNGQYPSDHFPVMAWLKFE
ncbi:MAG: endonuclease/exonuclease/phosphatase family protein [Verrucomicrobiales bacterium]